MEIEHLGFETQINVWVQTPNEKRENENLNSRPIFHVHFKWGFYLNFSYFYVTLPQILLKRRLLQWIIELNLFISENLCRNMLKVGPIIMVDSFFRASVLGKALGLTAQAVISHCLTEKHLLIMTADPECLWAYLKDLGND